jgi:hypothetical protein
MTQNLIIKKITKDDVEYLQHVIDTGGECPPVYGCVGFPFYQYMYDVDKDHHKACTETVCAITNKYYDNEPVPNHDWVLAAKMLLDNFLIENIIL